MLAFYLLLSIAVNTLRYLTPNVIVRIFLHFLAVLLDLLSAFVRLYNALAKYILFGAFEVVIA